MLLPFLVVSDLKGNIFDIPQLLMTAATVSGYCIPAEFDIIELPCSANFFSLPGRIPLGYDKSKKSFVVVEHFKGVKVWATAVFLPPGYIGTHNCAYYQLPQAPKLPFYSYSAVGWKNGRFYCTALRVDRRKHHNIALHNQKKIDSAAIELLKRYPNNRLIIHLVDNCIFKYRCPNACNLALGRGECPIPVSSACNACCIGCISKQSPKTGIHSPQHRIDFTPTADEIVEYVSEHFKKAPNAIASFGQGCEGEPLLQAELVEQSIRAIRSRSRRGIININTNASIPKAIEKLCKAGLDSIRVSLNSAQPQFYQAYYRPKNYDFYDVVESIKIAKRYKIWISLNYLVFPGFTNHPNEISAMEELLRSLKPNMLQLRSLNIDPLWFIEQLDLMRLDNVEFGMKKWFIRLKKNFPNIKFGSFNPYCNIIKNWNKLSFGN